jgi:sarcosine oxidase subunit alpha
MSEQDGSLAISVNGVPVTVISGTTVAAAILMKEVSTRKSVSGEPRGPLCGMGVCFECRVTINGIPHQRSCQIVCVEGMEVHTR